MVKNVIILILLLTTVFSTTFAIKTYQEFDKAVDKIIEAEAVAVYQGNVLTECVEVARMCSKKLTVAAELLDRCKEFSPEKDS